MPTYLKLTRSMGIISSMNQKYLDLTLLKISELMQMDFIEEEVQVCTLLDKYGARFQWEAQDNTSNTLILSCLSSYVMIWITTGFHLETPEAQNTKYNWFCMILTFNSYKKLSLVVDNNRSITLKSILLSIN